MSNVSNITPYIDGVAQSTLVADALAWLTEETEAERVARDRRTEQAQQRLAGAIAAAHSGVGPWPVASVELRAREAEPLLKAAGALGFAQVGARDGVYQLLARDGRRLAIGKSASGGLELHSGAGAETLQALVRQFTVTQAVLHLKARGMQPVVREAAGSIIIQGREAEPGRQAQVTAQVRQDGRVTVDVAQVQGARCEEIVHELAGAMGGVVESGRRKEQFWQPGEPARTGKVVKL